MASLPSSLVHKSGAAAAGSTKNRFATGSHRSQLYIYYCKGSSLPPTALYHHSSSGRVLKLGLSSQKFRWMDAIFPYLHEKARSID